MGRNRPFANCDLISIDQGIPSAQIESNIFAELLDKLLLGTPQKGKESRVTTEESKETTNQAAARGRSYKSLRGARANSYESDYYVTTQPYIADVAPPRSNQLSADFESAGMFEKS